MTRDFRASMTAAFFTLALITHGFAIEVIFIGLNGEGAPAIEKTFEKQLHESLVNNPLAQIGDYRKTQAYRNKMDFHQHTVVSKNLVDSLKKFASDSTLFIWGNIREYRIQPERRNFIKCVARGDLVIGITVYSLSNQQYAFSGNITASYEKSKGLALFTPVDKATHISALDRAEILERLVTKAVSESDRMISIIISSDPAKRSKETITTGDQKLPSLYDVFSVPSMEGATVELGGSGTTENTPTPDSGNNSQPVSEE